MIHCRTFAGLLTLGAAVGLGPVDAWSQPPVPTDTTASPRSVAADSLRLSIAPGSPTEGSIVRITFWVPARAEPRDPTNPAPADSLARRDTLARRDSLTRPDSLSRPDSLARPDTFARPDTVPPADSAASDTVVAVRATFFGEPLHFERDSTGAYSAFGGIPIGAPDSVSVALIVERRSGVADTISSTVRIGRGQYRMEKLAVAPAFGRRPDSALAARIARENRQAAEVSRRSHETPRLWAAPFQRPRTARVTSGFGDGRQFNGRIQSRHGGLDLAGAVGAPVAASNRGVVSLVGRFYYAGNAVYLDHGRGMVTAYFHLSRVDVAKGDTVEAGQRIGLVGATGRVTGPHLHWVARYGGVGVDPATLLPLSPIATVSAPAIAAPSDSAAIRLPRPDSISVKPPVDSLGRPIPVPPVVPPPTSPPPPPPPAATDDNNSM